MNCIQANIKYVCQLQQGDQKLDLEALRRSALQGELESQHPEPEDVL